MKICGVVVWYNPDNNMAMNIKSYINKVDKLYIVDNSNQNNEEKVKLLSDVINTIQYNTIQYIHNGENKGIAYALNIGLKKALENGAEYLLTMDQDSYFEDDNLEKYIDLIEKDRKKAAIYGISALYEKKEKIYENELMNEDMLMSSGMMIDLEKIKNIGFFKEEFFIDEVDLEFCYRAIKLGYEVKKAKNIYLNHKLGNRKKYLLCSEVTHHNYIRRYYIIRNRLYVMQEYPEKVKSYKRRIKRDIKGIILYEEDKFLKLKMCYLAYKDFKNNKKGAIPKEYLIKK